MDPTLRIKNVDANPVDIEPDGGDTAPVTVAPNADADLGGQLLSSKSFRALMAEGKVRFIETPNPTPAQFHLARAVLPRLLRRVGGPIVSLADLLETAKESLDAKRSDYNQRHGAAKSVFQESQDTAQSADHLFRGANHFLNTKLEEATVAQVEAEIAVLESEDLGISGRTLQEWFADRDARQAELEAAQAALATASERIVAPLAGLLQEVKNAATTFAAVDPNTDIGAPLPPFP